MIVNSELVDKTIRIFDKMFEYINNQNVTFMTYMGKDFPLSRMFESKIQKLKQERKERNIQFYVKYLDDIKKYTLDSKVVIFTILTNNLNINDVTYQYNDLQALYSKLFYKKEVFQIFVNCNYTNYTYMVNVFSDAFNKAIDKHYQISNANV